MKAILEFNLPDDQAQYTLANAASAMHSVLVDLDVEMRHIIKYQDDATPEVRALAEHIRREIGEILEQLDG